MTLLSVLRVITGTCSIRCWRQPTSCRERQPRKPPLPEMRQDENGPDLAMTASGGHGSGLSHWRGCHRIADTRFEAHTSELCTALRHSAALLGSGLKTP